MRWLLALAALLMLANVIVSLLVVPGAASFQAPLTQRILYYHVPAAWVAYLAFGVASIASAVELSRPGGLADRVARAAAESGALFATIALLTGLVWSRQEFLGYSAVEDPKVVTLVVLILAYVAYFALRRSIDDPARRKRLAAVYGLLAVVGVPLSYLASKASVHPDFTRPEQSVDAPILLALLFATVAFTALFAALVALRVRLATIEDALEEGTP